MEDELSVLIVLADIAAELDLELLVRPRAKPNVAKCEPAVNYLLAENSEFIAN